MADDSTVSVDLTLANRTLANLLQGLKDATPLARLIGEDLTLAVDDRFDAEVDPDGSPWAALDPKYVEWKQRKGHITKILQMRGDMRGMVAYEPFPDRVEIGTNVPYARRQHDKRPFLYRKDGSLGAKDLEKIEATANDYLQSLIDG